MIYNMFIKKIAKYKYRGLYKTEAVLILDLVWMPEHLTHQTLPFYICSIDLANCTIYLYTENSYLLPRLPSFTVLKSSKSYGWLKPHAEIKS